MRRPTRAEHPPTDEPSTAPTDEPSLSPTKAEPAPTDEPSATDRGVGGETGTPGVTPPSTSTIDGTGSTSGTSPLLLVVALVVLVDRDPLRHPSTGPAPVKSDRTDRATDRGGGSRSGR